MPPALLLSENNAPTMSQDSDSTLKGAQSGEETTLRGTGSQRQAGDLSPRPSSPRLAAAGHDGVTADPQATSGQGDVPRASSIDSAPLWAALDSPPRPTPTFAQFDEHEYIQYEDGEVAEKEDRGPLPNQEANRARESEEARERMKRLDGITSEHQRPFSQHVEGPTARKRSWTGSTVSEEDRRSARRPRVASRERPFPTTLPSIRDMIENPWGRAGDEGTRSFNIPPSVTMSTPVTSSALRKVSPFFHDELADVSGHPPTLRGSSIDSSAPGSARYEEGSRLGNISRASSKIRAAGMEIDDDQDLDEYSLLERPPGRSQGQDCGRREEAGVGPWNLRDALSEHESGYSGMNYRNHEELLRGGYRPREQENSTREERDEGVEPEETSYEDGMEGIQGRSIYSALPNTKAWEYRQGLRREMNEGQTQHETPRRMQERAGDNTSQLKSAGRSRFDRRENDDEERGDETRGEAAELEWWQARKTTRLPTALLGEEEAEDVPKVANSPHSDRWSVHLSDPEERYAGMSKEWMRSVWMDEDPIVLFTVFNYRFTKNQEINRHIETNVTAITTYLTGETDFHVVPPDPEWRHEVNVRDLPVLWVIRGLPVAAAWEMIKLRVISARGVSIITHPKAIENPKLVCGLAGFLRPDIKTTKAAVLSVLETDYMQRRLTDLVRTNEVMGHLSIKRRVEKVVDSLDVRFMATKEDGYVANIFMLPPTDDIDEWRKWVEEMRAYRYNVFLNGTGVARKPFWCGGCRGVDHEELECPFPKMKGWKGPQAGARSHSKYWEPEAPAGRRPGRGRGNIHWATGVPSTSSPTANARGARGWTTMRGGRGRGSQRGGAAPRGSYKQRGGFEQHRGGYETRGGSEQRRGMHSNWSAKTPTGRYGYWNEGF
ncbi:hypothetical protein OH76DRAFT_1417118 [Lentinus brumalis]|uniref:Uncharacterized protein n=1 Tax=Lentinus brumalis TaxID=2498619 RepID=A0A371DGU8_9APHY|nr:hypothetical protein OH76DRAFT_1417118 [Polyporus brumalis]